MWSSSRPLDFQRRRLNFQFIDLWVPPQFSQSKIGSRGSSKRALVLVPTESVFLALRFRPSGRLGSGICCCCLAQNWRSRKDFSVWRLTISTTDAVHWTRNWWNTSETWSTQKSAGPTNAMAPARFLCKSRILNARWGLYRSNLEIWGPNRLAFRRNTQLKFA